MKRTEPKMKKRKSRFVKKGIDRTTRENNSAEREHCREGDYEQTVIMNRYRDTKR